MAAAALLGKGIGREFVSFFYTGTCGCITTDGKAIDISHQNRNKGERQDACLKPAKSLVEADTEKVWCISCKMVRSRLHSVIVIEPSGQLSCADNEGGFSLDVYSLNPRINMLKLAARRLSDIRSARLFLQVFAFFWVSLLAGAAYSATPLFTFPQISDSQAVSAADQVR